MRIELKCRCGAEAVFEDASRSYCQHTSAHHDDKGRRYLVEVRADEWQERHQVCLSTTSPQEDAGGDANGVTPCDGGQTK